MQFVSLPKKQIFCGKRILDLSIPHIMGILNVTPDSFSDGGQFTQTDRAVKKALQMMAQGATIIDIGGESTRPGASSVQIDEELNRVIPVVKALSSHEDVILSIDTSEPEVIKQAVEAGAHIWNDVRALTRPYALQMAAKLDIPVVLMHMRGEPTTMNQLAHYDDVVNEVMDELKSRIKDAKDMGVRDENIIIDPGFGFAKDLNHNMLLLNQLYHLHELGYPILSGLSRKRFIGAVTECDSADERTIGSVVGHLFSIQQGASIVRVHDVEETSQAIKMWNKLQDAAACRNP